MDIRLKLNTMYAAKSSIEQLNQLEPLRLKETINDFSTLSFENILLTPHQQTFSLNGEVSRGGIVLVDSELAHINSNMIALLAGKEFNNVAMVNVGSQRMGLTHFGA